MLADSGAVGGAALRCRYCTGWCLALGCTALIARTLIARTLISATLRSTRKVLVELDSHLDAVTRGGGIRMILDGSGDVLLVHGAAPSVAGHSFGGSGHNFARPPEGLLDSACEMPGNLDMWSDGPHGKASTMSTRYLAFLRAVNVGGRSMKMADLRDCLTELGLANVGTVIQTGNVFFDAGRTSPRTLTSSIEKALQERFGFHVPTMLRTCEQVEATLTASPLRFRDGEPVVDKDRLVMFLDRTIEDRQSDGLWPLSSPKGDVVVTASANSSPNGTDLFIELHRIDGKTPNSAALIEKRLSVVGTGRWLHTTSQILRTARES